MDLVEQQVREILRVPINNSCITENSIKACISLANDIGIEVFKNSNLVKYINNTVNINLVTLGNKDILDRVTKFVKSGIAYWFLVHANSPETIIKRKEEIKLYFS